MINETMINQRATNETIENISTDEFTNAIQTYITWASTWDGALPSDVFFGVWADFQQEKKPLQVKARIVHGQLQFLTMPENSLKTINNSIFLEDGRELVVLLETVG